MLALMRTLSGLVVGGATARLLAVVSRLRTGHSAVERKVPRRSFVRNAALGSVLVILGQFGFLFVRFFWPNKTGAFGSEISVPAANVPPVNGTPFRDVQGKFYLVNTEDGLMALYWKCVHLGCTVPWVPSENQFHCPCHGSIYSYNGTRLSGPAPRPLDYMTLTVGDTGEVHVDTGAINKRSAYEPSQAVKI